MNAADLIGGEVVLWRGHAVKVAECEGLTAIVIDAQTHDLVQVPVSELQPIPKKADPIKNGLPLIPKEAWNRAAALAAGLKALIEKPEGLTAAVEELAKQHEVSERTIWRALDRFRKSSLTRDLLRRKPGRKKGSRMLDTDRELLIAEVIDSHYLKRERPTREATWEEIDRRCRAKGWKTPDRATVGLRIDAYALKDKLQRRQGAKVAKETCDPVPGHVEVADPLARIEIDHTLVDVILRADTSTREVVGRPWLTLAIDVATRMVMGFYISFSRPSAASVALCLAHAVQPKADFIKRVGVIGDWPVHGVMREIWVDNALEFHSLALRRGCEQYQISLNYRPVGSPGIGGTIERLIGTLMGKCHLLPGTTHSNVVDKGDYDAQARAVMTLREFIAWFTEQVVTQYHLAKHRTLGTSPLVAWRNAMATRAPGVVPANLLDFVSTFLPGATRTLTRVGVQMHNETYWCDAMSAWVGESQRVLVTYHPDAIRGVFVRLPSGETVPASITREQVPDVTVYDWTRTRHERSAQAHAPALLAQKDAGVVRNEQRVQEAQRETRLALRNAGAPATETPPPAPPPTAASPASNYPTIFF